MDAERRSAETGEEIDPAILFERARRVPVLALDDLGRERPTPWALERLASLVHHRYEHELPTIVTSNYRRSELAARMGDLDAAERIIDRLREGTAEYRFEGKTRRRRP